MLTESIIGKAKGVVSDVAERFVTPELGRIATQTSTTLTHIKASTSRLTPTIYNGTLLVVNGTAEVSLRAIEKIYGLSRSLTALVYEKASHCHLSGRLPSPCALRNATIDIWRTFNHFAWQSWRLVELNSPKLLRSLHTLVSYPTNWLLVKSKIMWLHGAARLNGGSFRYAFRHVCTTVDSCCDTHLRLVCSDLYPSYLRASLDSPLHGVTTTFMSLRTLWSVALNGCN